MPKTKTQKKEAEKKDLMTFVHGKKPAVACILLTLAGYFLFSVTDATSKYLTSHIDTLNIMFWAGLYSCITLCMIAHITGDIKKVLKTNDHTLYLLKGTLAFISIYAVLFALREISLTEFYAIIFISPILSSVLAKAFFKDNFTLKHLIALLAGFIGVLITTKPTVDTISIGMVVCIFAAVTYTLSLLVARQINKKDSKLLFGISVNALLMIYSLILLLYQGKLFIPSLELHIFLLMIGVLAGLGNTFVSTGYQNASSVSIVAPFHYTQIFWGALFGYAIWGDIPAQNTILGSLIIILSGLWIIYSENKIKPPTTLRTP